MTKRCGCTEPEATPTCFEDVECAAGGMCSRSERGDWDHTAFQGLDANIELASLGVRLALEEIYAGLAFRPAPKLVETGGGGPSE